MRRTRYNLAVALSMAACGLSLASCSSAPTPAISKGSAVKPVGSEGPVARFINKGQTGLYETYDVSHYDIRAYAEESAIVFIGTITSSKAHVADDGPETVDPSKTIIEQDGITFRIEDILAVGKKSSASLTPALKPDSVKVGDTLQIVHPATIRAGGPDQAATLLEVDPISVVRDGLVAVNSGKSSPSYIVFLQTRELTSGQFYSFNGPGGVAEVSPTGQILQTSWPPFATTRASENFITHADLTIEAVKKWIAGSPPPPVVPEAAKPKPSDTIPDPTKTTQTTR